jgi:hypothetical protein
MGGGGQARQRRGAVDADHSVPTCHQISPEPALAAADVDRQAAWRRQQLQESVTVKVLVRVVPRLPRPTGPRLGVALPGPPQVEWFVTTPEPHHTSFALSVLACTVAQPIP